MGGGRGEFEKKKTKKNPATSFLAVLFRIPQTHTQPRRFSEFCREIRGKVRGDAS